MFTLPFPSILRAPLLCLGWLLLCVFPASFSLHAAQEAEDLPGGARALLMAYPEQLQEFRGGKLIWRDGTEMAYDDGRPQKTFAERFNGASLRDQMLLPYPLGRTYPNPPGRDVDPGRFRCEAFFLKMYGRSAAEVERNLVPVVWMPQSAPQRLRVTRVNGIAGRLEAVAADLEKLSPEIRKASLRSAGTFNWRTIAGTERLSEHSFGIAIDLNLDYADYWRWGKPGADGAVSYRNRMPLEIVEAFEKQGFIWGGKWYHFDTMHFEYRPELLIATRAQQK